MIATPIVSSVVIAAALVAPIADPKPAVRQALDVQYAKGDSRQVLDVIAPKDARDAPVVIFVHGGTWMIGDKNLFGLYRQLGTTLAEKGYVAVMVNYRLSPFVKHPEHARDVARAYAWTRKNIGRYGGDPDRIVLMGHSAGGHLVALVGSDESYLKDPALKLTDKDRAALKGVVAVCGVYRIPDREEFGKMAQDMVNIVIPQDGKAGKVLSPVLVKTTKLVNPFPLVFGNDPEVWKQASPITHVHKGMPPFLVLTAGAEITHLPEMADEFTKALKDAGNSVERKCIDGCDHNMICFRFNKKDDPTAAAVLPFLEKTFAKSAKQP